MTRLGQDGSEIVAAGEFADTFREFKDCLRGGDGRNSVQSVDGVLCELLMMEMVKWKVCGWLN